jgi:hypothetical protein
VGRTRSDITFCSHVAMRGAAPRAIQELVGQRDIGMMQPYMHLRPAAAADAIRLLDTRTITPAVGDMMETGNLELGYRGKRR